MCSHETTQINYKVYDYATKMNKILAHSQAESKHFLHWAGAVQIIIYLFMYLFYK